MNESSNPSHIAKNIGIGVITSVLAAVIIYFAIGDPKKAEFKKRKAATQKAWSSFMENTETFEKAMKSLDTTLDDETNMKVLQHQIDIAVGNLENIKKETDADQRVFSAIDITIQQIKEMKPIYNDYFSKRNDYIRENPLAKEDDSFFINQMDLLLRDMKLLRTRDTLRENMLYNGLVKDYDIQ